MSGEHAVIERKRRALSLNVRLSRTETAVLLAAALLLLRPLPLDTETLTVTSQYPPPYGVYSDLRATDGGAFATQGGGMGVGAETAQNTLHVTVRAGTAVRGGIGLTHTATAENWSVNTGVFPPTAPPGTANGLSVYSGDASGTGAGQARMFIDSADRAVGFQGGLNVGNVGPPGTSSRGLPLRLRVNGDLGLDGANGFFADGCQLVRYTDTTGTGVTSTPCPVGWSVVGGGTTSATRLTDVLQICPMSFPPWTAWATCTSPLDPGRMDVLMMPKSGWMYCCKMEQF